ncbi:unnamed protein product [Polarella glacialis]|uniref:Uncharacterized protein n=1 Tax=Polarella glacialis TaxID=89957 RepID=A0A813INP7_POLGL|nr:unnamed protein product [Polarella glacialis]
MTPSLESYRRTPGRTNEESVRGKGCHDRSVEANQRPGKECNQVDKELRKQFCRLMSYMSCTRGHTLRGYVADKPEDLWLELFVDSDFCGSREDAKSTSGGYLVLKGPNTYFPIMWVSKKQTSSQ